MKVIKPLELKDSMLINSGAAETYSAYAAGTNYPVGTAAGRCIWNNTIYESVQTPNSGHQPDLSPLYWAVKGVGNRWAMFDAEISTQTVAAGALTVVLNPGYANSIALFGLVGDSISVVVRDGLAGEIIYSKTKSLDGTIIASYDQYFFEPGVQLDSVIFTDIPPYLNAHFTVTITGVTVKCGVLMIGTAYFLGQAQRGAHRGILDFSKKDTDLTTGITKLKKGKNSKPLSVPFIVDNGQLNKIDQIMTDLLAVPCAWIPVDYPGYEFLTIFGFATDFGISIAYATESLCNLEIQGLT